MTGVPVLRLRDGTVQVGCDADHGVRLPAGDPATLRLLRDLTGHHSPQELVQRCGLSPRTVDDVLAALHQHRLLDDDDAAARGPLDGTMDVRVVGEARWVPDLVLSLLDQGVRRIHVVGPPQRLPATEPGTRRWVSAVPDASTRVRFVEHAGCSELPPGIPTVVAASRLEAAAEMTTPLVRHDDPHVVARPRPGGVVLGPFVVPGRTSCLACADHARTAMDPTWPDQLIGLAGTPADVPSPLVGWVVTTLVAQLAAWASGSLPDLADRTVEMDTTDWRQHWRAWRPHPSCGCR